tara:strand:- start:1254 stop:1502 length:249 start_codon:yes stop_codon:yes gene_type:complete
MQPCDDEGSKPNQTNSRRTRTQNQKSAASGREGGGQSARNIPRDPGMVGHLQDISSHFRIITITWIVSTKHQASSITDPNIM